MGRVAAPAALLAIAADVAPAQSSEDLATSRAPVVRFRDAFEGDLRGWEVYGSRGVRLQPSGDPERGTVLVLSPHGDVHVLVKGSSAWTGARRIEGMMRFVEDVSSYLGVLYNYRERAGRKDFGLIYVKGDESYLQANPHRDYNVSRTFYPEYHLPLVGPAAVRVGEWQRFRVEVHGDTCHFYVGDMGTPQMTFALAGLERGALGLQPRSVGGDVWVDDVTVSSIPRLSYDGPPRPALATYRDSMLTDWSVVGPLVRTDDGLARDPEGPAARRRWRPFSVDARGGVATGTVVDYHGAATVAYFLTRVRAPQAGDARLEISGVEDIALWVNGRFHWFIPSDAAAWFDFPVNVSRARRRIPVSLRAGDNNLVVRVRGGRYASGGFFARVVQVASQTNSVPRSSSAVRSHGGMPTRR